MYERFTDRARNVLQLANAEAQRFNHESIGAEHILLGLIKEGTGVAANVLKNLDIDLRKIRQGVEKFAPSGPDMATIGKLPQSPRATRVIQFSMEEARALNHEYVGTEHILLGLLREELQEGGGSAGKVLIDLGLKLEDVREEVLNLLGHGKEVEQPATKTEEVESDVDDFTSLAWAVRVSAEIMLRQSFGERCEDYEEDCPSCRRWNALDVLVGAI